MYSLLEYRHFRVSPSVGARQSFPVHILLYSMTRLFVKHREQPLCTVYPAFLLFNCASTETVPQGSAALQAGRLFLHERAVMPIQLPVFERILVIVPRAIVMGFSPVSIITYEGQPSRLSVPNGEKRNSKSNNCRPPRIAFSPSRFRGRSLTGHHVSSVE